MHANAQASHERELNMKVLIVGGTGLLGGHAALYLKQHGHDVTLMARKPPTAPALANLPFIMGDYVNDDCRDGRLSGFDWLLFAAGADGRHMPYDGSVTAEDFFQRYNIESIPRFFEAARDAGIRRAVYIGSFYPQVVPDVVDKNTYVRSRKLADDGVRRLNSKDFTVISLNAPVVLGHLPGLDVPHLAATLPYLLGKMEGVPLFAPEGGTNHITVTSLSQAVLGAFQRGEPGRAYLVGDQNLSWEAYYTMWLQAAGKDVELPVRGDEHPLIPDVILFAGRGATLSYEPEGVAELGYDRNLVRGAIEEIVAAQAN
jgi:dihydroflavonol-4-reductase